MAITPNDAFVAGQVLSSTECNNFPRGVMALATSSTNYTLTTSDAIATGMTLNFTAEANRNYKITYIESGVNTPSVASGSTTLRIRQSTSLGALGAQLGIGYIQTPSATLIIGSVICQAIVTYTAGIQYIIGSAITSSTTGTPLLYRAAGAYSLLMVEDIGTA